MDRQSSAPFPDLRPVVEALELTVLKIVDESTIQLVLPPPAWFDTVAESLVGTADGDGDYRLDPLLPFASFADAVVASAKNGGGRMPLGLDPVHLDCDVPQVDGMRVSCRISFAEGGDEPWIIVDRIAGEAGRQRNARQTWRSSDLESIVPSARPDFPANPSEAGFSGAAVLKAVFAASGDGIVVTGPEGGEVFVNAHACELLGLSAGHLRDRPDWRALRSMLIDAALSKTAVREFCDRIETGVTDRLVTEWKVARPVTRHCRVEVIPFPDDEGAGIPGTVWIVCEMKEITGSGETGPEFSVASGDVSGGESEIGQLAAGIAHDFNNLLAIMIGNLGLVENSLLSPDGPEASNHVSEIRKEISDSLSDARVAADRAARLVRKLLSYSRRAPVEEQAADLNAVILNTIERLRHSIRPEIVLQLDLDDDLWPARVDAIRLAEVLEELCQNAANAVEGDAASIQIQSRNVELTDRDTAYSENLEAGSYAVLSVADAGQGIAPEDQDRIFEPFFTTRKIAGDVQSGDGQGMGLASARGTVRQLGGELTCSSLPGEGAVFNIYLPRCRSILAASDGGPPTGATECPANDQQGGNLRRIGRGRRVLIVDDDPSVRSLVQRALRRAGYSTTTAEDGRDAIACVNREGESAFDLIILDLCMPRMSGAEAYQILNDMGIRIPVVISSGYVVELNQFERNTGNRPAAFLPKPYTVASLLKTTASLTRPGVSRLELPS